MLWLLLLACHEGNSCARYVAAASGCVARAGGDASVYDEASICGEAWTDALEDAYGARYACAAEAWEASSCAGADAVAEAATAAAACDAE